VVQLVSKVLRASPVLMEPMVLMVLQDQWVRRVKPVRKDLLEIRVQQVRQVRQVHKDLLVQPVLQDQLEHKDLLVPLALLEYKA
jgi:hypothetical protein